MSILTDDFKRTVENYILRRRENLLDGEWDFVVGKKATTVRKTLGNIGCCDNFDEWKLVFNMAVGQEETSEFQSSHMVIGSRGFATNGFGTTCTDEPCSLISYIMLVQQNPAPFYQASGGGGVRDVRFLRRYS